MSKYGIWQIQEGKPVKLPESAIELEKHLEDWIEKDPNLLLPGGWDIICRQMSLPGGRLDLLALDPQGMWVVIELKAGYLDSDVVTQALYYAAQIDAMPIDQLEEKVRYYLSQRNTTLKALLEKRGISIENQKNNREVQVVIAGTKRTIGIETLLRFLSKKHEIPVTLITFEVYQLPDGQRILLRELTEADLNPPPQSPASKKGQPTFASLQKVADETGIGQEFKLLSQAVQDLGLSVRLYDYSLVVTAPNKRTISLLSIPVYKKPLRVWLSASAFSMFYPVNEEEAIKALGKEGWHQFNLEEVEKFIKDLTELLSKAQI